MVSALLVFLTSSIAFVYHSTFFENPGFLAYPCPSKTIEKQSNKTLVTSSVSNFHSTNLFIDNSAQNIPSTSSKSDSDNFLVVFFLSVLTVFMLVPLQYLLYCSNPQLSQIILAGSLFIAVLMFSLRFNKNNLHAMKTVTTLRIFSAIMIISQVIGCLHYFYLIRFFLGAMIGIFGMLSFVDFNRALNYPILA